MTAATHILAQLSEYTRPGYWYGVLGLIACYVFAIFLAALLEKERDTRQYANALAAARHAAEPGHVAATNERAADLGFTYGGSFKHPKYDVQVSVWISDDHLTLIGTGAGTILTRPVAADRRFPCAPPTASCWTPATTTAAATCRASSSCGSTTTGRSTTCRCTASALNDRPPSRSRSSSDPRLDAVNAIYTERTERLIRRGCVYIAADGKRWRYTPRGRDAPEPLVLPATRPRAHAAVARIPPTTRRPDAPAAAGPGAVQQTKLPPSARA